MGHENVGVIARAGRDVRRAARPRRGRPRLRRALRRLLPLRVVPRGRVPALRGHRLAHQPRRPPLRLHLAENPATCGAGSPSTCTCPGTPCCTRCPDSVTAGAGRHRHAAVQRHRVGAGRRRRRLRLDRAHPGAGPAGPVAGRRLQAGRRLARSSSPARPGTRPGWSWPRRSAPTTSIDVQHEDPLERILAAHRRHGRRRRARLHRRRGHGAGAARHRRAQAPRGHDGHPGRAGRVPRLPAQEGDREGDHHQERPRAQLPLRELALAQLASAPLPAGAAGHAQLRPRRRRPRDPRRRRRGRARASSTSRCCPGGRT